MTKKYEKYRYTAPALDIEYLDKGYANCFRGIAY